MDAGAWSAAVVVERAEGTAGCDFANGVVTLRCAGQPSRPFAVSSVSDAVEAELQVACSVAEAVRGPPASPPVLAVLDGPSPARCLAWLRRRASTSWLGTLAAALPPDALCGCVLLRGAPGEDEDEGENLGGRPADDRSPVAAEDVPRGGPTSLPELLRMLRRRLSAAARHPGAPLVPPVLFRFVAADGRSPAAAVAMLPRGATPRSVRNAVRAAAAGEGPLADLQRAAAATGARRNAAVVYLALSDDSLAREADRLARYAPALAGGSAATPPAAGGRMPRLLAQLAQLRGHLDARCSQPAVAASASATGSAAAVAAAATAKTMTAECSACSRLARRVEKLRARLADAAAAAAADADAAAQTLAAAAARERALEAEVLVLRDMLETARYEALEARCQAQVLLLQQSQQQPLQGGTPGRSADDSMESFTPRPWGPAAAAELAAAYSSPGQTPLSAVTVTPMRPAQQIPGHAFTALRGGGSDGLCFGDGSEYSDPGSPDLVSLRRLAPRHALPRRGPAESSLQLPAMVSVRDHLSPLRHTPPPAAVADFNGGTAQALRVTARRLANGSSASKRPRRSIRRVAG